MRNIIRNTFFAAIYCLFYCSTSLASDFNVPFVSASGLGNFYSDWATNTDDASNAFMNPAGLTQLHHQQLVIVPLGILGSTRFTGTSNSPYPFPLIENGSASSHIGALIPAGYYALPINRQFAFGLSLNAPFGLGTNYPTDGVTRYQATRSEIAVVDLSPSIGYQVTPEFSLGFGIDFNRLTYTLNNMVRDPYVGPDFQSQNHLTGYGYGWHGGLLYQPFPKTRVGISFNSMVSFNATGNSELFSPYSEARTTDQKTNARLPARTQLSIHQDVTDRLTLLGTIFYTNWRTFQQLTEQNVVVSPTGATESITLPFNYHNTFDYSMGLNFKATDKWMLKTGLEFTNAPSNNQNRGVGDPVGSTTIFAIGAHYQQDMRLSYDLGVAHSFFKQNTVNVVTPIYTLTGHNNLQTTIFGGQVNWNIA